MEVDADWKLDICHFQQGVNSVLNVKAIVGAFNQEKALVGAFNVIMNLRLKLYCVLRVC